MPASPSELAGLNEQILSHPNDAQLNLRYASLAERLGLLRLALAAYERVLINDPNNTEAQRGLDRVRRGLQPNTTQYVAELGTAFESNPFYASAGSAKEAQLLASLTVRDERTLFDTRWRTVGTAVTAVHSADGELNYGYLGGHVGPVWDFLPGITVHPALGAAGAYLDQRFFYTEGSAGVTFEANPGGAYRAITIRGAYRDYDSFFPSTRGGYLDVAGKFSFPGLLGDATVVTLSPWGRWSNISGSSTVLEALTLVGSTLETSRPANLLEPGAYNEAGARIDLYRSMSSWLTLGLNASAIERFYRSDLANGDPFTRRRDVLLVPGAAVIFPNAWGTQRDLRFDYMFLSNHSNDINMNFIDHLVKATLVARF